MRVTNRLLSALLALALIVGGLLVAVEVVMGSTRGSPWVIPWDQWYTAARQDAWSSRPVRALFVALLIAGALLLLLQIIRRGPAALPVAHDGAADAELNTASMQRSLARAARQVDSITGAAVSVSRRRAHVSATTSRRTVEGLEDQVRQAVEGQLDRFSLRNEPEVVVRVRSAAKEQPPRGGRVAHGGPSPGSPRAGEDASVGTDDTVDGGDSLSGRLEGHV